MQQERDVYIARQLCLIAGRDDFTPSSDLAARAFYELSRQEELDTVHRDQWGNWEWPFSKAQREGKLYQPWLDTAVQSAAGASASPRWPGGKTWVLCLTHDVDRVGEWERGFAAWRALKNELAPPRSIKRLIIRSLRAASRTLRTPLRRGDDPLWCYEKWLEAERRHGFSSSWLFFPSAIRRRHTDDCHYGLHDKVKFDGRKMKVRDMMAEMTRRGCDVGLHGSCHTATDAAMLAEQREEIEAACGRPVVSTRQHYLCYRAEQTPAVHVKAGLGVDSTQGFNRSVGFRAGTCFPYWCWGHAEGQSLPVLEVPLVLMDSCLFGAGGLEYNEHLAVSHTLEIMDRVQQTGGVLTLNWHPDRIRMPGVFAAYQTILEEAARRDPWCATLRDLLIWRQEWEAALH